MKKLALTVLLAGTLCAASAGLADEPRTGTRHFGGNAARQHPGPGGYGSGSRLLADTPYSHDRRPGKNRRPDPSYGRDRHDHDDHHPGRHRPWYGSDRHRKEHGRHDRYHRDDATGEMVVGGLLGGFLGNAMSSEGYRTQGTILGALLGTAIGYGIAKN